ncbi:MFS transporter [Nocardia seriolae]|uniref:MFS transporter n=1 Tax=Nocardia seriolae TaxID=37332 RepID=A0A0B8NKT7_9NOCA|nr:MFS transporter [Nocardia seriolae]APA98073.1 Multidrug resistance protein Stp [Nocardia seriolae]MTJ62770.1 MFS transporter [Nocardia seriolae]MTJ73892.1 MFS transporter [Nocardia seriolae]MTJ87803.1 MFS transporter [Nocardia seriolae]MTK31796.1 MFS transporter [Nocardia seriolae]
MRRNRTHRDPDRAATVLATLACGQFLMILDSSVMNVSMAAVSADLDTPVSGIQTAITLYTLVMASLMITGGRVGAMLGRRRAFGIGLVVYGSGSLTTSLAPNLTVLLIGWSLLEGLGATLIMPAIVALVSANFAPARRTAAYGLIAAAGAIAVAVGPLLGGAVTTSFSWRYVFAGEVVVVLGILLLLRRIHDTEADAGRLDVIGSLLSVTGLSAAVFGVLQSSAWGWVQPRPGAPRWAGLSPTIWLILSGIAVLYGFFRWQTHLTETGGEPLIDPDLLRDRQLSGGLGLFFAQYFVQGGVFFTVPLFLSVLLELTALGTGVRILPLSVALVLAAVGIPKLAPRAAPRTVVRLGLASVIVGILVLMGGLSPGADAGIVMIPMIFLGLGLGALSSQLGSVTTAAVPDSRASEVGGLQNTATCLGTSLGTALVGSVLIAALPEPADTAAQYAALRVSLAVTVLFALAALFATDRIPRAPIGVARPAALTGNRE